MLMLLLFLKRGVFTDHEYSGTGFAVSNGGPVAMVNTVVGRRDARTEFADRCEKMEKAEGRGGDYNCAKCETSGCLSVIEC
jgi:hypothetical protein